MAQHTIDVPDTHDFMVLTVPKTHTPIFLEALAAEGGMQDWQTATIPQRLAFFKQMLSTYIESTAVSYEASKAADAARSERYAEIAPLAEGSVTFL